MAQQRSLGVVLRYSNYRENDRMLSILTRDFGKIDALCRGCRKQGSPLLGVSDTFCCAQYDFYVKKDRWYITQAVPKESFFHLRENMKALMAGAFFLEVCEKTAMPEDQSLRTFALLVNALFELNRGADAVQIFCFFVVKLLDILGLRPETDRCVLCGNPNVQKINIQEGGAVCADCPGEQVPPEFFAWIRLILSTPSRRMGELGVKFSREFAVFQKRWLTDVLEQRPRTLALLETACHI